jgi:hypothetical protein
VLLRRTGRFDLEEALNFPHAMHDYWRSIDVLRPTVFLLGSIGLAVGLVIFKSPRDRTLLTWALGFLFFWLAFDLGYRLWMFYRHGQNITAFTPTRGLTNLAWPMAIAGAALLARIPGGPRVQRALVAGTLFAVASLGYRNLLERVRTSEQNNVTSGRIAALCDEVRAKLPEDVAIFTPELRDELWQWVSPLCRRESNQLTISGYAWPPWYAERKGISSPQVWAAFVHKNGNKKPYFISYQPIPALGEPAVQVAGMWLYPLP